ncbi:MAG: phosphohydrolase [Anaerolineaceae bacterium]|nr:phosphohydrolase [Anaerolineaceae bacterium]
MDSERLQQQLAFIAEIDKLKSVLRRNYLVGGARRENTGEHSWHVALAAIILSEYTDEPIELDHVIKLLLVHDIVEIDAGDTFAYDVAGHDTKDEREQQAADRLFGLLPDDQRSELRALWDEFEALETPNARFARAVDMFMPMFHNVNSEGRGWRDNGVTSDQVFDRQKQIGIASETLHQKARALVAEVVERGFLPK